MNKKEVPGTNKKPTKLTVKRKTIRDLETTRPEAEKVRGGTYSKESRRT
ncbi:MAG: hypothetical protein IPP07_00225 [Holophagales bacterium]|nr:hypothetical protein [Holophagales bacterium]